MRDEKEGRKKQARSNKQTTRQSNTVHPKAVSFPKKNELHRVGLEPTTLHSIDRHMYMYMYICTILHVQIHVHVYVIIHYDLESVIISVTYCV